MEFLLSSRAFGEGETIPQEYTCEGADISPSLSWSGAPTGTVTYVLILEDLDAPHGLFTHWLLFDVPAATTSLREGISAADRPNEIGLQGRTTFGRIGYGGPCPPSGESHRYRFSLYALDVVLGLEPGAAKQKVVQAMEGHVLAETHLTARYKKGR